LPEDRPVKDFPSRLLDLDVLNGTGFSDDETDYHDPFKLGSPCRIRILDARAFKALGIDDVWTTLNQFTLQYLWDSLLRHDRFSTGCPCLCIR
jgi:hypothetical protein